MTDRLRAYGAMPCEVPTIAVEPPRTPQQMERAIKGLVDRPLRVGRVHLGQRGPGGPGEVRRVRPGRPRLRRRQDRRVGEATAEALVRPSASSPELVPSGEQSSEGLLAEWPPYDEVLDPIDRVLPAARRHRHRDAGRRADRARLGGRRRHGVPDRARRAAAGRDPRGDQVAAASTRCCSPRPRPCATWSASPASRTRRTVVAVIGPKTAEDRGGARPAGRRRSAETPSVPALVEALAEYARELRVSSDAPRPAKRGRRPSVPRPSRSGRAEDAEVDAMAASRTSGRAGCAVRRRCAGWSRRPRCAPAELVLPMFVREGIAEPRADRVDAGRRPAHPGVAAQGGRRGGRGRRRRHDALRRPERQGRGRLRRRPTRTASSTSRSATWSPRSATRPW